MLPSISIKPTALRCSNALPFLSTTTNLYEGIVNVPLRIFPHIEDACAEALTVTNSRTNGKKYLIAFIVRLTPLDLLQNIIRRDRRAIVIEHRDELVRIDAKLDHHQALELR